METMKAVKVVTYAVLIEAREMRTAFGFSLADAVDEARGEGSWGDNPKDCQITVRYLDGREMFVDTDVLSRPTVSKETMRQQLIDIAEKALPELPTPCPWGMTNTKETWERWIDEGPSDEEIQCHQGMSARWAPRQEIEAYERENIPK